MSTKAFFPCEGGSNLILGTGMENQIFILRTAAAIKFFHQNCHFAVKNKSLPTQMDFYDPYMVPYSIPYGYCNIPRDINKIPFFDEISTCGKIVDLMMDLKYKHQGTFPLWGSVKLNFRDRYGKLNIFSDN